MSRLRPALLLAIAIAALALIPPAASEQIEGRARVIDGDTVSIGPHRIRLHGIDAPETAQTCLDSRHSSYRCGARSAQTLVRIIAGRPIQCSIRTRDRYGRSIAQCFAAGADIGAEQVRLGMALAYRRYSRDYVSTENAARAAGAGIWSGTFEFPWNWRRTH